MKLTKERIQEIRNKTPHSLAEFEEICSLALTQVEIEERTGLSQSFRVGYCVAKRDTGKRITKLESDMKLAVQIFEEIKKGIQLYRSKYGAHTLPLDTASAEKFFSSVVTPEE